MAIIIGAIGVFLIAVFAYIGHRINEIREEEKLIYDTIFLMEFFQYIAKAYVWDKFFSEKHEISVKRNVTVFRVSTSEYNNDRGMFLKLYELKRHEKMYLLEYEFTFDKKQIKVYTYLPKVYKFFLNTLKGTEFFCTVEPTGRRLEISNSIKDRIYSVSRSTLLQCLAFALENRVQRLRDISGNFLEFFNEIRETKAVVSMLKKKW